MRKHNGKQLYGIQRLITTLKMGMNKELKGLSIKQKLAMNYVSKESKLTSKPEEKLSKANVHTIFEIQKMCAGTKGYPGVFAYDFFESEKYYGCGAGFNYMFIDSQGNVCPCDFTMLSFGNILNRPVKEIFKETSQHFCTPGPECYANISNDVVFSKKTGEWPLKKQATIDILDECPSFNNQRLPEFYKRMGFMRYRE